MIQKTINSKKNILQRTLLILIVFSLLLSACGVINEEKVREETEGFIQDEWAEEGDNPKRTISQWWEDTITGQEEKVGTGFDRFMDWLPDSIAKLFGWEETNIVYIEATPGNFSNKDQVLDAFEFQVPSEVFTYFDKAGYLPLDEIRLRLSIIKRAEDYPSDIPYDSAGTDVYGYRTDGSGFVSYAWQLDKSVDPTGMIAYSREIDIEDLMPGDILNNKRYAFAGHIVLFSHWVNFDTKTFKAYHMNTTANGVSFDLFQLIPVSEDAGTWTIKGIEAEGPFYPYRWNGFILEE